jgi:hypothetical protein
MALWNFWRTLPLFAFLSAASLVLASTPPKSVSQARISLPEPHSTLAFTECVKANESPIFPGNKLVTLCLDRHELALEANKLEATGAYVRGENDTTVFAVRVKNLADNTLISRFEVVLKHDAAEAAQYFSVGPLALLPSETTTIQLPGLLYVPPSLKQSVPADFKFAILKLRGLHLRLQ